MAANFSRRSGFLTPLAVLTLVLVLVNVLLSLGNQSLQEEVNDGQQFISHSIQLDALHREVVAALANLAVKTNDPQLKDLLASSGVSFSVNPESAGKAK